MGKKENENIELYDNGYEKVAAEEGVPFLDALDPTRDNGATKRKVRT